MCATISSTSAAFAAAIICSASATFIAIGFSTSTALPAPIAASACGAWRLFGVPMMTASTAGSVTSVSQSVGDALDAVLRGEHPRALSRWLATPTTRPRPVSRTARTWRSEMKPQPRDGDSEVWHGGSLRVRAGRRRRLRRPPERVA